MYKNRTTVLIKLSKALPTTVYVQYIANEVQLKKKTFQKLNKTNTKSTNNYVNHSRKIFAAK